MGSGITVVCICLLSAVQYLCAAVWLQTREGAALALAAWRSDSGPQARRDGGEMLAPLQKLFMLLVAEARRDLAREPRQRLRLRGRLLAAGWGAPGVMSTAARCRGAVLSAGRWRLADTGPYLVWHFEFLFSGLLLSSFLLFLVVFFPFLFFHQLFFFLH